MSRHRKILTKVLSGVADANIPFEELCVLLTRMRFEERIKGSHHIFTRDGVTEILNLQEKNGKSKPYQVKQVREVILRYRLGGEE